MQATLKRILAYLTNDLKTAEALGDTAPGAVPAWIISAAADEKAAEYAVDVARKSQELAESAVKSLQDKASGHLTFLLALVPFALGATALTVPAGQSPSIAEWASFVFLAAADFALIGAFVMTALAAGIVYGGGISLDRLGDLANTIAPTAKMPHSLRAAEAEALRYAAILSYESGVRVANDLFAGRRLTLIAVLLATCGVLILVAGGGIDVFQAAPTPTPTP